MTLGVFIPILGAQAVKGKHVVRGLSVVGFSAVAVVAVSLGWQDAEPNSQESSDMAMTASVALEPSGGIVAPAAPRQQSAVASYGIVPEPSGQMSSTGVSKSRGLSFKTAQTHSNNCRIPDGSICYVAAARVGSTCRCPGSSSSSSISGIIVP